MEMVFLLEGFCKILFKMGILLSKRFLKIGLAEVFFIESPNQILSVKSIPALSFSHITNENVTRVLEFQKKSYIKKFKAFLHHGDYGIFAFFNGIVVGHVWAIYSEKDIFRASEHITLSKGECLIHYAIVNPLYRRKNIYTLMIAEISKQSFKKYNPRRIIIECDINNIPSIKGIIKSGYQHLGFISYVIIRNYVILKRKFYK